MSEHSDATYALSEDDGEADAARGRRGEPTDFVFTFSYETYSDAVRRGMMRPPDRILSSLIRSPEVRRLLVADPFRWLPRVAASPVLDRDVRFPADDRVAYHRPTRLRRDDPVDLAGVAIEYARYDRSLERAADRLGLVGPHVLTTNPLVAGFAPFEWASGVTFFARDDWLSSPARRAHWPAYREAYRRISATGRSVAAVSAEIIDRIGPTGPAMVVPNGVEPDEWLGLLPAAPAWFAEIPGPRAVYVGTLDSRLDVPGIADLAARRPELQVVLLGPCPDPAYVADLQRFANVHVHPSVARAELVATLRNAEVCLLAHRRTPLTEAMSPLKVYEYLAAGVPVVSIDLPPVRDIDDRVLLVDRVADFADAVDVALGLGRASEELRLGFIEANSWSARHEMMLGLARP
ncbi:Glycosyl transferases group 1 [Agromyces sp. CF514]|uniref:glycosyltransferase n=1 Tax=Agromyces sp. CF514 TaxID=1881031 RepID=UPI0008F37F83|nr:glycosyltransferase [Agromyces sp. CF514]SFR72373.1 Glycosyl transferases group 1 [Agromyces sp. CF514]